MIVPGLGGAAPEISEKARDSGLQGQKLPVLTVTFAAIRTSSTTDKKRENWSIP